MGKEQAFQFHAGNDVEKCRALFSVWAALISAELEE